MVFFHYDALVFRNSLTCSEKKNCDWLNTTARQFRNKMQTDGRLKVEDIKTIFSDLKAFS